MNPIGPGKYYSFTPTYCFYNCSANACPEESACIAGVCVWNRYEKLWKTYLDTIAEGGGAFIPVLPMLVPSGHVQGINLFCSVTSSFLQSREKKTEKPFMLKLALTTN